MRYTMHRCLTQVTNWVRLKYVAMNLKKLALWGHVSPFSLRFLRGFALFSVRKGGSLAGIPFLSTV